MGTFARPVTDMPLHGHHKYSYVRDLDKEEQHLSKISIRRAVSVALLAGTFGLVQLAIDLTSGEQVAIKFIERCADVSKYVQREILNHRRLMHPHIVHLKEVFLTPTHLGIAMEYAAGGNLYQLVAKSAGLPESDARWYFQQLVFAIEYCHRKGVCSRDIKLENTLLASPTRPLIKLCDFGYSKDEKYQSAAASKVGTPAYLAPEVVQARSGRTYDGKAADVWSCGVMLFVMLSAQYPFGRPEDAGANASQAMQIMLQRIVRGHYKLPAHKQVSSLCRDLLSKLLTVDPLERISLAEVQQHPWFRQDLPEGVEELNSFLVSQQKEDDDEARRSGL